MPKDDRGVLLKAEEDNAYSKQSKQSTQKGAPPAHPLTLSTIAGATSRMHF